MIKKKWGKAIAVLMALSIMGSNTQVVNALENDANNQELNGKEMIEEIEKANPEIGDKANSWRYKDGEPIYSKLRYKEYSTWPTNVPGAVAYGIDVSEHQNVIDWAKVKNAGVDYAIVRCGYGMDQADQDDDYWKLNADACVQYGIPFGTYLYSYADSVEKAKSEAEHVLRLVDGYNLSYPIYYDLEESSVRNKLSSSQIADIAETFCDIIEDAGYEVGIYSNTDWFTNYLTDSRFDQWDKWVAQYNSECTYKGVYEMWQCSSKGIVDGISGYTDLNIDLGAALDRHFFAGANGFCQSPADGEWYYYKNSEVQYGLNDIISGTVNGVKGWWYIVDGKVVYDTTVVKNRNGWWKISAGKVDFSYNGFAENNNGWWYCKGGKVQFGTNSVISGTVNDQYGWWHVIDGKVTFDNTVASNGNGWWLIENGKVNFEAETVAKNSNGWWKISEGKVDFNYNGFAENNNGWWYCKGGKVQFGTNSVISGTVNGQYGWWHVVNGKVTFDNTVASNGNGWWVIQNGKVNFAFNGTYKTENITYMISGGKVISTV